VAIGAIRVAIKGVIRVAIGEIRVVIVRDDM